MQAALVLYIAIVTIVVSSWIGNFIQLTDCDFESPYKCEVIHGVGVIPAISVVTVWFDADAAKPE